jgi:hypothetical protein
MTKPFLYTENASTFARITRPGTKKNYDGSVYQNLNSSFLYFQVTYLVFFLLHHATQFATLGFCICILINHLIRNMHCLKKCAHTVVHRKLWHKTQKGFISSLTATLWILGRQKVLRMLEGM